ncbi:MAG: hypothetical protein NZL88_08190 [Gaiellaceae bacterium]|nr:hypothetical protein [Gaiellaceae bacterium]
MAKHPPWYVTLLEFRQCGFFTNARRSEKESCRVRRPSPCFP